MAGVGGLSSLGLFLLLLLASSSAAREERSMRNAGWGDAALDDIKFFALLQYEGRRRAAAYCSGSIISPSAVLTYCDGNPTKAHAGLLQVGARTAQEIDVDKVVPHDKLKALKICFLKKNWTMSAGVAVVDLPTDGVSVAVGSNCLVLGFTSTKAHKQNVTTVAITTCGLEVGADVVGSAVTTENTEKIDAFDVGGPLVCENTQRGISEKFNEDSTGKKCNVYIDIAPYSPWIEEQKQAAEDAGASGGTGGNGTSPSSGYSIHSYLNKYSNWKVLWFLVPTIVTFLQY